MKFASEHLRALDAALEAAWSDDAVLNRLSARVADALPELIAVVEAAEACKPSPFSHVTYISIRALEPLHTALAALQSKLEALA